MTARCLFPGVFWNLDYSRLPPISPDIIYNNIKSALAQQGHHGQGRLNGPDHGQVSVWAYCDDDDLLLLPNITMVPTGNPTARFKQMLKDILLWALFNPAHYPRTVPCLMVISDISGNRQFARVLQTLVSNDYNVLLTVSGEMEYLRSLWLYPNLKRIVTRIFWNLEDCPVPGGLRPEICIYCLAETLSTGFKSVMAYGKKRNLAFYDHLLYGFFPVTLVPTGNKDERIKKMFKDIFLWALDRPRTSRSTVVVITESFPDNMYDAALAALSSRNCELVLVDPHAVSYVKSLWLLQSLFGGGNLIDLRGRKKA
ncbi:hypothetical protein F2Q69_00056495 [Brassica cretica]|uniref:NYN domain-containing protein n=1 Tax=Brassica cretica TaxID=69181 RepID=A0A8S9MW99_BRACR|nr:hypothetical protein F2Q69_00056495 [Brassica cretica]